MNNETIKEKYVFHLGIAEQGKIFAVQGNYKEALRYYKEAIKMTENKPNGELFFQNYAQCLMEALEQMGAYEDVINYCKKFIEFLEEKDEDSSIIKYRAEILQRMAIQYIYLNDKENAKDLLKDIQKIMGIGNQKITDELLNWLNRGYTINKNQIFELQVKNNYFIVKNDSIKHEIAIELPTEKPSESEKYWKQQEEFMILLGNTNK